MMIMNNFDDKASSPTSGIKAKPQGHQRKIGVLMTVLSAAFIVWAAWQMSFEPARIRGIVDSVSPLSSFPDVFMITSSPTALYSVIGCGAFIVLCMGIYRIVKKQPMGYGLKFLAFIVGFAIIIGHAMYINSVREPVFEELVSVQHEWAEERYGIIYDEIIVLETEGRKNKTIKNQDQVVWQGDIIAEVCQDSDLTILFCEPGTDQELFVMTDY